MGIGSMITEGVEEDNGEGMEGTTERAGGSEEIKDEDRGGDEKEGFWGVYLFEEIDLGEGVFLVAEYLFWIVLLNSG